MSKFRAPLSIEQLKEIQGRNESADVLALLWEIRRLREIAAAADNLDGWTCCGSSCASV